MKGKPLWLATQLKECRDEDRKLGQSPSLLSFALRGKEDSRNILRRQCCRFPGDGSFSGSTALCCGLRQWGWGRVGEGINAKQDCYTQSPEYKSNWHWWHLINYQLILSPFLPSLDALPTLCFLCSPDFLVSELDQRGGTNSFGELSNWFPEKERAESQVPPSPDPRCNSQLEYLRSVNGSVHFDK